LEERREAAERLLEEPRQAGVRSSHVRELADNETELPELVN
jgi:hypothetical protein